MGDDFRLRLDWPGDPTGLRRGPTLIPDSELRLHLDPQVMAQIRALAEGGQAPRLRDLWLAPNWARLAQLPFMRRLLSTPPPPPPAPLVPRGRGPATPRPGEVSDLMRAIWGVPAVRQAANRVLDQVTSQLRRGWGQSSPADRALLITQGAVMAGTALAPLLAHSQHREAVLGLIEGRDLPIPGYPGASVRISRRGGGATLPVPGVPQVVASGSADWATAGRVNWEVMIRVDVGSLLRSAGIGM